MQMTETDRSAVGYTVKTRGNEQMVRGVSLRRKKEAARRLKMQK